MFDEPQDYLHWTFRFRPVISQLGKLSHLTLTSVLFAEAHSNLLAKYTVSQKQQVYKFPSLLVLQMNLMAARAMSVPGMMELPVLVSLGLWQEKWESQPKLLCIEPESPDTAYPIHLPAVKTLILYELKTPHSKINYRGLIQCAPLLTHLVLSHGLSKSNFKLDSLILKPEERTEEEVGGRLCPSLERLSIYNNGSHLGRILKDIIASRRPTLKVIRLGKGMMRGWKSGMGVYLEEPDSVVPPFRLEMLRISPP